MKRDGSRHEIDAQFSRRGVLTADVEHGIEPGDLLERNVPIGGPECYEVLRAAIVEIAEGVAPICDCSVRRIGSMAPRLPDTGERNIKTWSPDVLRHLVSTGATMRVVMAADLLFARLRVAVVESLPKAVHEPALAAIASMKETVGTDGFPSACARFLGIVAEEVRVFRDFVPALATLAGWSATGD